MLMMYWEMIKARLGNEKGQGMVEYGLILGLIAVGAVLAFTGLGDGLGTKITAITTDLANAGK